MFIQAIVKRPCENFVNGITSANLGQPIYEKAVKQHKDYIRALANKGIEVIILGKDENFPDSVFVEDTAVLTKEFAIITNPGARSRKGEIAEVQKKLGTIYRNINTIKDTGTLDGGDVMQAGKHFFIGLTERTNHEGARQFNNIVSQYGYTSSTIQVNNMLHLKTGASYLENNNLLILEELSDQPAFKDYNKLIISKKDAYSANSIWVNGTVIIPWGFPETKNKIEKAGYPVIELDMSEFQKLDGGLSCLSLRF